MSPGAIEVRVVAPEMLPAGRWWFLVPPVLGGPLILTSDLDRLKREVKAAAGEALLVERQERSA